MIFKKISPNIHQDDRGNLFELLSNASSNYFKPKHIYISNSYKGVIRGFHQQLRRPQKKIVFCLSGRVHDYGLNINPLDINFGKVKSFVLDGEKGEGVFIGKSIAHGFECLTDKCTLLYICDEDYIEDDQLTINVFDKKFSDLWIEKDNAIISPKDASGISLKVAKKLLLKLSKK